MATLTCSVRPAQTERLQALLADNDKVNLADIEPIPLPLEPEIRIRGIVPETATLFKVRPRRTHVSIEWCRVRWCTMDIMS